MKSVDGLTTCPFCRAKYNARQRSYVKKGTKKQMWKEQGLCLLCGGTCKDGYKLCEKHWLNTKKAGKKGTKDGTAGTDDR